MTRAYQTLKDRSVTGKDGNCLHEFHFDEPNSRTASLIDGFASTAEGASASRDLEDFEVSHEWTTVGDLTKRAASYKGDCPGCSAAYMSTREPPSIFGQRSDDCPVLYLTAKLLSKAESAQRESQGTTFVHMPRTATGSMAGGSTAEPAESLPVLLDSLAGKLTGDDPEGWRSQILEDPTLGAALIEMTKVKGASEDHPSVSNPRFEELARLFTPQALQEASDRSKVRAADRSD